jgi:hypothetical protein
MGRLNYALRTLAGDLRGVEVWDDDTTMQKNKAPSILDFM